MKATQLHQRQSKRDADSSRRERNGQRPSDEALLRKYRRRPTVSLRNELIEMHRPTVESVARTLCARLPRSVDVQDLVHAGIWGLMQAIESFDVRRGIPFGPFMRRRARGAMLDELRNLDYLPRLYRQLYRERDQALAVLRSRLERDPSDAELAAELGVSEARLRRVSASVQPVDGRSVMDASDRSGGAGLMEGLADEGVENPIEALNRQDLLQKIEASLEPVEWQVLEMHYLQGLPGKEIARRLNLSASRICQIHGRVLSRLKARLRNSSN